MLKFIVPFLLGVIVCATFSLMMLSDLNDSWMQEAYDHGCGVWRFNDGHERFQWMDDYLREEHYKHGMKYYPPQTPSPLDKL